MFPGIDTGKSPAWVHQRGAIVRIGCFSIAIDLQATETDLIEEVSDLYELYPQVSRDKLPDFAIALRCPSVWRPFSKREIQAHLNGHTLFEPLLGHLGVPMLESGINWLIATNIARFLLLHAGVVERNGKAVVLPGESGSGKSTLCAALVSRGWRLLSDEFAMVRPDDGRLQPHPRPISLKNNSIDMIANKTTDAHFSKRYEGTIKGTIAFIRAPHSAIEKADETVRPALVIFPRYGGAAHASLEPLERAQAFMRLIDHSMNYSLMMEVGFETLATLVEACNHYVLSYHELDEAVSLIESLESDLRGIEHVE